MFLRSQSVSSRISFDSTLCKYITNTFVFWVHIFLLSSRLKIHLLTGHLCTCFYIPPLLKPSLTIPLVISFFGASKKKIISTSLPSLTSNNLYHGLGLLQKARKTIHLGVFSFCLVKVPKERSTKAGSHLEIWKGSW